jgi:alanyl-tRNA synthetase
VQQAGSVVDAVRLRFDFSHPKAVTKEEIRKIEDWVNRVVHDDHPVSKVEMSMDEAKAKGAIAFFGDKYGDRVRVVTVGPSLSVELCGGTHLEHSATIGELRITGESAIGAGVRRIEAVTGPGAVEAARAQADMLLEVAQELGCPLPDVPKKLKILLKEMQELKSRIGQLRKGGGGVDPLVAQAKEANGEKFVASRIEGDLEEARAFMDLLTKQKKIGAAILAVPGEKPVFVIGVREDLVKAKGLKAGDLAKEVGKACGGGGGGRDLQAQCGAGDPSKIDLGLQTFETAVRAKL